MRLLLLILLATPAMAQMVVTDDGDWHLVPEGKQVVYIPDGLPLQCEVTCTAEVEYPGKLPPEEEDCCPIGELCVSPSIQCEE